MKILKLIDIDNNIEYIDANISPPPMLTLDDAIEAEQLHERSMAINGIATEVEMLYDMFLDINQLVEEQGEQLDLIEDYVNITNEEVMLATEDVIKSQEYQSSSNKLFYMTLTIPLAVIAVIKIVN